MASSYRGRCVHIKRRRGGKLIERERGERHNHWRRKKRQREKESKKREMLDKYSRY